MLPPIRFSFYRKAIGVERSNLDLIFKQVVSSQQKRYILGNHSRKE
jgi:hypothetical protein